MRLQARELLYRLRSPDLRALQLHSDRSLLNVPLCTLHTVCQTLPLLGLCFAQSKALQAGAFGGSRQAVQQGLAEEQLLGQLANIQAKGSQSAFADASKQFGADRAAQMTAEQRRAAELGRVQSGQEASSQFGAGQGLAALKTGAGLGTELSRLGQLERQTDIQNAQLLEGVGKDIQAEGQAGLDLDYANFLEQQGYTREQIGNMTCILSGMPIAATGTMSGTSTTPVQRPSPFSQALGAGLSGLSLYKAFV